MLKKGVIILLLLGIQGLYGQLLPMLSQYRANSFIINPAIPATADLISSRAGTSSKLTYRQSFGLAYRSQWWAMGADRPQTATAHFQRYVSLGRNRSMWAGGYFLADRVGLLSQTAGYLTASFHYELNERNHIFGGLSGGFGQRRLRTDDLVADNIFDPLIGENRFDATHLDAGWGLFFRNDILYAGVSMPRVSLSSSVFSLKPSQGRHLYFLAGGVIRKSKVFETIEPRVWVRQANHTPLHIDLSCRFQPASPLKVPLWFAFGVDNTVALRWEVGTLIRSGWTYQYPDLRIGIMYSNRITYIQGLGSSLELTISALMR